MKPSNDYFMNRETLIEDLNDILFLNQFLATDVITKRKKSKYRKLVKKMLKNIEKGNDLSKYFEEIDE